MALAPVRTEERGHGYVRRLEVFAERQRGRLEGMLRVYVPGSAPAEYGQFALVGLPESLVICERLESVLMLPHGCGTESWRTLSWTTWPSPGGLVTALAGEQPTRRDRARDRTACLAGRKVRCPRCGTPGAADLLGARQWDESPPSKDRSAVEERHDLLAVVAPRLVVPVRLGLRELLRFARRLRNLAIGVHPQDGHTNIAAALHHTARDCRGPLTALGLTRQTRAERDHARGPGEATEPQSPSVESSTCGTSVSSNVIASLTKAGDRRAEDAPPLTSEQVDRIVAILRLSGGDDTQLQHIA